MTKRVDLPLTTLVYIEVYNHNPNSPIGWYPPSLYHLEQYCRSLAGRDIDRFMLEELIEKIARFKAPNCSGQIFLCPVCEYAASYKASHHAIA